MNFLLWIIAGVQIIILALNQWAWAAARRSSEHLNERITMLERSFDRHLFGLDLGDEQ